VYKRIGKIRVYMEKPLLDKIDGSLYENMQEVNNNGKLNYSIYVTKVNIDGVINAIINS
jgi:hypothetical protein